MKKALCLTLCIALVFALAACTAPPASASLSAGGSSSLSPLSATASVPAPAPSSSVAASSQPQAPESVTVPRHEISILSENAEETVYLCTYHNRNADMEAGYETNQFTLTLPSSMRIENDNYIYEQEDVKLADIYGYQRYADGEELWKEIAPQDPPYPFELSINYGVHNLQDERKLYYRITEHNYDHYGYIYEYYIAFDKHSVFCIVFYISDIPDNYDYTVNLTRFEKIMSSIQLYSGPPVANS